MSPGAAPGAVTLIGGGALSPGDLDLALSRAPRLVAADGGADAALAAGRMPAEVIGDFDSLSAAAQAAIPPARLHRIAEQDSTDFEKCLTRITAPFVIAVGFTGARIDHALAVYSAVAQSPQRVVLLGPDDLVLRAPSRIDLPLTPGTRVSLFPMGPARGTGTGLHWPIDGIEFAPGGRIGTSNRATGPVTLTIAGPMLLILPRDCLDAVLATF